jgi:hypothetical protein
LTPDAIFAYSPLAGPSARGRLSNRLQGRAVSYTGGRKYVPIGSHSEIGIDPHYPISISIAISMQGRFFRSGKSLIWNDILHPL